MSTKQTCRQYIDDVKEVVQNDVSNYVAKTRLERLILSCARLAAEHCGTAPPSLPGRITLPEKPRSPQIQRLVSLTNRVLERSNVLCTPSESLDDEWKNQWEQVVDYLNEMDNLVGKLEEG